MCEDEQLVRLAESGSFRVKGPVLGGDAAVAHGRRILMEATDTDDVESAIRVALDDHGFGA